MKIRRRSILMFVMVGLLLALPTTALAFKRVWTSSLSFENELHTVVGSSARGSAAFRALPNGSSLDFFLQVRNLSGPVMGAHIHAPADTTQNAPVVVTLCGNPGPAAVTSCSVVDGVLTVQGTISGSLIQGMTAAQFMDAMDTGMAYINVHTALNPAGEARGQIILH